MCSPRLGKSPQVTCPAEQFREVFTSTDAVLLPRGKSKLLSLKLPSAAYPELVSPHRKFDPKSFPDTPEADRWENFESPQDVCATAYWYQTLPSPVLPPLQPYVERMKDLGTAK